MTPFTIALVGNPNSGKTTVFNVLTGSHQRVGNWPGVTVEKKTGDFIHQEQHFDVVDLPGVYSLNASLTQTGLDERLASDYILSGHANAIVNIVDASNLERHLYLTTQLLEMGIPVIVALNMMDIASKRGINIDCKALAKRLDCPVIPLIASKTQGFDALKMQMLAVCHKPQAPKVHVVFPEALVSAVERLGKALPAPNRHRELTALRLLESDEELFCAQYGARVTQQIQTEKVELAAVLKEDVDILIADSRYSFICDVYQDVVMRTQQEASRTQAWLDHLVLNRVLGIPIFLLSMYSLFFFAINVGGAFQDFFDMSSRALFVEGVAQGLSAMGTPQWLTAILAAGVGKGINTTLTFIPVIGAMYFFLAFLEGSGYMARAAFVVDRAMRALGLPGKAFVPMIVGFGCNVPAIMGARTLEHSRDRILTVLMTPFMSCSARLAIYAVFISAFFPVGGQNIVFLLYLIGIVMAVLTGLVLQKTLLKGDQSPLLLELPAYRMPTLHAMIRQAWLRLKQFLWRAGKVIVPVCILLGTLNAIILGGTFSAADAHTHSLLSYIGRALTPLFSPLGLTADNWPATVGLLTGVLAKEVVIATLNTLYMQTAHLSGAMATSSFDLWLSLKAAFATIPHNIVLLGHALQNPIGASMPEQTLNSGVFGEMYQRFHGVKAALAYLLFVLLYVPCVSTSAAIGRELNKAWMWFSTVWSFLLAYGTAVAFYQVANWLSHPLDSALWLVGIVVVFITTVLGLKYYALFSSNKVVPA